MKQSIKYFVFVFILCLASPALATVDQVKLYKKVFGDKPKCISCHTNKTPKKEEGKHELNDYGKKLKETKAKEMPDEDTYKTVGKNEKAELVESE